MSVCLSQELLPNGGTMATCNVHTTFSVPTVLFSFSNFNLYLKCIPSLNPRATGSEEQYGVRVPFWEHRAVIPQFFEGLYVVGGVYACSLTDEAVLKKASNHIIK